MKKVSIVLPVYNESEVIVRFNEVLFSTINELNEKYSFEVIYVLDKSSDNSFIILKKIADTFPNVKVLLLSKRFGHQASLLAGMDESTGDAVIMMDSDLEHPPALIKELLQKWEEGFDVVNTKRIYNKQIPFFKKIMSKIFYKIINSISSVEISEGAADFRLLSRRVVDIFRNNLREQNLFLRGLIRWVGFNQTSVTFKSDKREAGVSKYNINRLLTFAISGIVSFSKKPIIISIIFGFIISLLSILYGCVAIIQYFFNKQLPMGWTTLIVVLTFLGGIQLIFLGVIGIYIGAIFDEIKDRPLYIIEEKYSK